MAEKVSGYDPELVANLFKKLKVLDVDDEEIEVKPETHKELAEEAKQVYARSFDDLQETNILFTVLGSDDHWHVLKYNGESKQLEEVRRECKISMEVFPPTGLVEYCFEDGVWRLSHLSPEGCTGYINTKFERWEGMMRHPSCEAALLRQLRNGLVTNLFDSSGSFPEPPGKEDAYTVTNEKTGALIKIPHPVTKLRVYNAETCEYSPMDARLKGAPAPADEVSYWKEMLAYLRQFYTPEMEKLEGKLAAEKLS